MKYPKHLFLTYGSYGSEWWSVEDDITSHNQIKCSPEDRAEVLEYSLAALHFPSLTSSDLSSSYRVSIYI